MLTAPHAPRHTGGFGLIETIVVVAIAAILVTAALPAFGTLLQARRLDGTASQLGADLRFARAEAIARNQAVRWTLHTDSAGSCYLLHTGSAGDCTCSSTQAARCTSPAQALKTVLVPNALGVTLQSNVASLLFDPQHGTSSPAATLRVLGAGERAVHQVVNVMGRVRACSPLAAVPGYRAC